MKNNEGNSNPETKRKGTKAALRLLERTPDENYLKNWTDLLAKQKVFKEKEGVSVIIFRLSKEWLAINSGVFCEVISQKKVHRIPHRSNDLLRGLVNYQGVLKLCINIHSFLMIEQEVRKDYSNLSEKFQRMISIEKEGEQWVFSVDEVQGVFHVDMNHLKDAPVTVSKSKASYLRGMIDWNGKNVGYIDEELLFFGLRRGVL